MRTFTLLSLALSLLQGAGATPSSNLDSLSHAQSSSHTGLSAFSKRAGTRISAYTGPTKGHATFYGNDGNGTFEVGLWVCGVLLTRSSSTTPHHHTHQHQKAAPVSSPPAPTSYVPAPHSETSRSAFCLGADLPPACSQKFVAFPGAKWSNSANCGACMRVTGPNGSVDVQVTNEMSPPLPLSSCSAERALTREARGVLPRVPCRFS